MAPTPHPAQGCCQNTCLWSSASFEQRDQKSLDSPVKEDPPCEKCKISRRKYSNQIETEKSASVLSMLSSGRLSRDHRFLPVVKHVDVNGWKLQGQVQKWCGNMDKEKRGVLQQRRGFTMSEVKPFFEQQKIHHPGARNT